MATTSAPHGSIVSASSERADLLCYEVLRKIEKEDIEWMASGVEAAFNRFDVVDILLVMRNYDGAELGAIFDAKALKAQAESARHLRRYAVVGAPLWAKAMINLFSPVSPVEARTFDLEEESEALAWVNAS